jgi:hypothetical protein
MSGLAQTSLKTCAMMLLIHMTFLPKINVLSRRRQKNPVVVVGNFTLSTNHMIRGE